MTTMRLPLLTKGLVMAVCMVIGAVVPTWAQFDGGTIHKNCVNAANPTANTVKPGDVARCTLTFTNADTFGHALRVDAIKDCVLHGGATTCPDGPVPPLCTGSVDPGAPPSCSAAASLARCQTGNLLFAASGNTSPAGLMGTCLGG